MKQNKVLQGLYENKLSKKDAKKTINKRVGNKGEDLACVFLMNIGFEIVARNYLKKVGEIDVIALENDIFHFVEVKSVTRETSWDVIHETQTVHKPENNVYYNKLLHMKRAIEVFFYEKHIIDPQFKIDVITVTFYRSGEIPRIDFIENIIT
jgi:putative endonuclease